MRPWVSGTFMAATLLPTTDPFEAAVSFNAQAELGLDLRLSESVTLGLGAGYVYAPGVTRFDESTTLAIDDDPVPSVIGHERTIDLGAFFLHPTVGVQMHRTVIDLGARIGWLVGGSYTETQQVVDPPGVEFDEGPVRIDATGAYPGLQLFAAWLTAGVSTAGARFGDVRLEPGLEFAVALTTLSTTDPLRMLSGGLRLRMIIDPVSMPNYNERTDTVRLIDTVFVESAEAAQDRRSVLTTTVSVDTIGTNILTTVEVREQLTRTIALPASTLLTEAGALFVNTDGSTSPTTRLLYRVTRNTIHVKLPASCEVEFHSPQPSREAALAEIDRALTPACRAAIRDSTQRLSASPSTAVWVDESWGACTVQYTLDAVGDVEVEEWSVTVLDTKGATVDLITGSGTPPASIQRSVPDAVLSTLKEGGVLTYRFVATDADGARTAPVGGTLTFQAFDVHTEERNWDLVLPDWKLVPR